MVERLFLAVPRGCLEFVIVVFPNHTHLLFKTFDREINIEHKQIPKRYLKNGENYHDPQHIKSFFCIRLC